MKFQYKFVFVDHTTAEATLKVATVFDPIIDAIITRLEGSFCDAYGEQCCNFRVIANPDERQSDELAVNFRDTIPEAPNALAYHNVVNGIPDIEVGVDLFQSLTQGTESVSGGVSHEVFELLGDNGANMWADRQDGSNVSDARELCDFVQNTGWEEKNGVWIANTVLPSFFIPGAGAPWDMLSVMKSQYDVSNGYGIVATTPNEVSQIGGMAKPRMIQMNRFVGYHGELSDSQKKRKSGHFSRTHRRGVRI